MGRKRVSAGAVLLVMVLWAAPTARTFAGAGGGDQPPGEYQVKAAFLFNFARFVEWPPRAPANSEEPVALCVLGDDPFGDALDRAVAGKTLNDRTMAVRRGRKVQELNGCEVLFISTSEKGRLPEILTALRTVHVLTVGECEDFAAQGGEVQFTLEDNHVRFIINVDATDRAGLKVSSKLLGLAHVVHGDALRKKS
jgi:YfiR/HmsC-like